MKNVSTFTVGAAQYARFRPTYPASLFTLLASLAPARELAWDCATGTGQAAVALANHFDQVVGTDVSTEQIQGASRHEKITYSVSAAERSTLATGSVDLLSVAQAVHWFDIDGFYAEARRVLKPRGVIALWAYDYFLVEPAFDAVLRETLLDPIVPFWCPANHLIFAGYRTISFPFAEIETPAFAIETTWSLDELCGYLCTWSAVKRYIVERGMDPVAAARDRIGAAWGNAEARRNIRMPLHVRVGKKD